MNAPADLPPPDGPVLSAQERDAWPAPVPPADFVDRVMDAHTHAQRTALRHAQARAVGSALLLAAGVALGVGVPRLQWPADGALRTEGARQSVALGQGVSAVLEPGAALSWSADAWGAVAVQQDTGRAFYRVEPGHSVGIETTAGRVQVHGTCLDVEVVTMNGTSKVAGMRNALAGAAVGAAVVVGVYEGRVALANDHGQVQVGPGERARAQADAPPQVMAAGTRGPDAAQLDRLRAERDAMALQVADVEDQLRRMTAAQAGGKPALLTEVETLRAQVATLRNRLREHQQAQAQQEGEPRAFPNDLPQAYREEGLRQAFEDAMREVGLPGEIRSMDCTEFPCMVYGETRTDGDKDLADKEFRKLEEALEKRYPGATHNSTSSVWSSGQKDPDGVQRTRSNFGVSVYPKDTVPEAERDALRKRMRWRSQQYMDTVLP